MLTIFRVYELFHFYAYHSLSLIPLTTTLFLFSSSLQLLFSSFLFCITGRAESTLNLKIIQYDEDMYARHTALEILKTSYATEFAECAVLEGT